MLAKPFVCLVLGAGPVLHKSLGASAHPLLAPFLNRSALWYLLRQLQRAGLDRVLLICDEAALGLSSAALLQTLADLPLQLRVISSAQPALWRAALLAALSDEEPVFVAQHPTLDGLEIGELQRIHSEQQADCTLRLSRQSGSQSQPLILGADGQLQPEPQPGSQLVYSTGSCLIEPDMLEALLEDGLDLVHDPLIPALLTTAEYLSGCLSPTPWNAWRQQDDLLRAEASWLETQSPCGTLQTQAGAPSDTRIWTEAGARWAEDVRFTGTVLLGAGVEIGSACVLQGPLVIGAHSRIAPGCQLSASSLGAHSQIGPGTVLHQSWLSTGVQIAAGVQLRQVQLGPNSQLTAPISLPAGSRLGAQTRL